MLAHLFPQADVPVVQLSLDRIRPHEFHYEIGKQLDDETVSFPVEGISMGALSMGALSMLAFRVGSIV